MVRNPGLDLVRRACEPAHRLYAADLKADLVAVATIGAAMGGFLRAGR
jgi:hypothetical protein